MCFGDATHLPSIKFQTHKEPSKETAKSRRNNNNNNNPSKKEIINPFQKEKKKNCSEELNYDKVPVQTVRVKSNTHSVIVTTVDSSPLKTAYMVQFQLVLFLHFLHFLLRLGWSLLLFFVSISWCPTERTSHQSFQSPVFQMKSQL